ncbi:MAG: hypothetical protein AAFR52_06905 [Pseudomonadota bacterium]
MPGEPRPAGVAGLIWRLIDRAFLRPYRPELHYMRGPRDARETGAGSAPGRRPAPRPNRRPVRG